MKKNLVDIIFGIIVVIIVVPFFIIILSQMGEAFRTSMPMFIIIWITTPVVALIFLFTEFSQRMSSGKIQKIKRGVLIFTVAISFMIFAHMDDIVDNVGDKYIEGYYSVPYTDIDEYGSPNAF